ncbi:beta-carotene 15,15'-dioxygenase, Brp/Blh family, partial [Roseiarcus sp.]|uniref:beta-carotene 15,15'-dioxygenase, Brp/Blh family n=1 Tax=Roseiarcus sp. TaxID=1969460 RepID=UPI003F9C4221
LVLALGVPHGALDTVFARNLYGVSGFRGWAFFGAAYFVPAAIVVGLWAGAPLVFLTGFLVVSLVHFSGDPVAGTPFIVRVFYGGAIIILPCLFHWAEVSLIFSLLVGAGPALAVTSTLHAAGWPWLLATLLAASSRLFADRSSAAEIAAVALLAALAPPLIAFTVFFCLMHSARHVLRTFDYFADVSPGLMIASAAGSTRAGDGRLALAAWLRVR